MDEESSAKFTISNGDKVWVPSPDEVECYREARVREKSADGSITVFDDNYKSWEVKGDQAFPINPKNFDGVPDNTQLMFLQDPSLLHNIKCRYLKDEIYTYTAYILIAVNPYKRIKGLYDEENIQKYSSSSMGILPPHVYAIADRAYRMMRGSNRNQSIVVSGESGAGKTETCKYLMKFLATVGGAGDASSDPNPAKSNLQNLEMKVLEANPILEAFGNAKTLRNNNSSRFGKFTELHFDRKAQLAGASIVTYLLEKSRVVGPAKNERNFHVFYQMLTGASTEDRAKWKLCPAEQYNYLNCSGSYVVDGVDDASEYAHVRKCMTAVGIAESLQNELFAVLSGILRLGNIDFQSTKNTEKEDVTVVKPTAEQHLADSAELLGFDKDVLMDKLCFRTLIVGKGNFMDDDKKKKASSKDTNSNVYRIPLSPQEACYARDALAKYLYSAIFDWIVTKINESLPCQNS